MSKKMYAADPGRHWTRNILVPTDRAARTKEARSGRHWHFLSFQFWILTGVV